VDVRPPQPGTMSAFHRCNLDSEPVPVDPFQYDMVLLLDVDKLLQPQDAQMLEAALPAVTDVKAVA